MAERKSETARPEADEGSAAGSRQKGAPRGRALALGRGIASVVVLGGLLYLCGVGLYSVIPQVFWPEAGTVDESVSCVAGLTDLRGELFAGAGDRVANAGGDRASLESWLHGWDRRHLALEARCAGEEHDAWELLGRTRQRLEGTLTRFDATEGVLAREMDHTLSRAVPSDAR